jgi:hypothetical protein
MAALVDRVMRATAHLLLALLLASSAARAGGPPLRVTQAKLDANLPGGDLRGKVVVKATADDSANGGSLETALLSGAVTLEVRDAGAFAVDAPLATCAPTAAGVRCTGPGRRLVVSRTTTPFVYRLSASLREVSTAETGSMRPVGPVRVTLARGTTDDIDTISDCSASGTTRLRCQDHGRA